MEHNSTKPNYNWVKNLYFYVILAGTILTIAIAAFALTYSSLVRFVFTDLQNKPYISYEECKNNFNYFKNEPPVMPTSPSSTDLNTKANTPDLTQDEQKNCANKRINTEYQTTLLSSGLAILVAGIILSIHLYLFRKNNSVKM